MSRSADRVPDKRAVIDDEADLSYGELFEAGQRAAGGLRTVGLGEQDAVLIMLDNHVDHVRTWVGVCFGLAVEVPVNTAFKGRLLSHIINDSGARVMVIEEAYCPRLADVADDLTELRTVIVRGDPSVLPRGLFHTVRLEELLEAAPVPPVPAHPGDLIGYLYTSGTTGPSRGAMIPYGQAWSCGAPEFFGWAREDDRTLVTLPLFHVVGQWAGVLNALIAGATAIIRPGFHASTFWDEARHFDCTYTLLLGAMANFLFRQPKRGDDPHVPIRTAMMLPVIPEVADFQTRFDIDVLTAYGMTELSSPLVSPPGNVEPGGCGWVRPDFEARVVDGRDLDVPQGEVGELLLRPRDPWSTMIGYRGNPEKTLEFSRNLWLHTGDLVYQASSGQYFFVDRQKDALRRRGENVSSFEVEGVVNSHPAVLESIVIGVPSAATEEDILVAVALEPGADFDLVEFITFLADHLPYFMVPRYVRVLDDLPRTSTQKLQKHLIRDMGADGAWDREAAGVHVSRDGVSTPDAPM